MTEDRWELLIHVTRESLFGSTIGYKENITKADVDLIVSVLKDNIPFGDDDE